MANMSPFGYGGNANSQQVLAQFLGLAAKTMALMGQVLLSQSGGSGSSFNNGQFNGFDPGNNPLGLPCNPNSPYGSNTGSNQEQAPGDMTINAITINNFGNNSQQEPLTDAPVTNNGDNQGGYWGDPHLVGFDGEKYDVMGEPGKTYNMYSDQNVQYNAQFVAGDEPDTTYIGKAGIQVGNSKVEFDRDSAAPTVNGVPLQAGQTVPLQGGLATWDGTRLLVKTNEVTFKLSVGQDKTGGKWLRDETQLNPGGVLQDGVKPHGLVGQTADDDSAQKNTGHDLGKQGGTVIDGTVQDYEVGGLWNNNFRFNRFRGGNRL